MSQSLTVSLGFRDECPTGWNEAHGRAANYTFTDGVISTDPRVARSSSPTTREIPAAAAHRHGVESIRPEDRIRAGFGMYNDLQDALGYRTDQNAPFNPTYSIAALPVSRLPMNPGRTGARESEAGARRSAAEYANADADFMVAASGAGNFAEHVADGGLCRSSHGYHELIGIDGNEPVPVICPASPCPAVYPTAPPATRRTDFRSARRWRSAGAGGIVLHSGRTPKAKPNPALANTWTWFSEANELVQRAASGFESAFQPRAYLARRLYLVEGARRRRFAEPDDGEQCAGAGLESIRPARGWGLATYNVRNIGVINAIYELPFGQGRHI